MRATLPARAAFVCLAVAIASCSPDRPLAPEIEPSLSNHALSIVVDPGTYAGQWFWNGGTSGFVTGPQTVSVDPGSYQLRIGATAIVDVTVDASGGVTSTNSDAVVGGAGTLSFQTIDVAIEPGAYSAQWLVSRVIPNTTGPSTVTLVRGVTFGLTAGVNVGGFNISIDGAGNVTSLNADAAVGGLGTLDFNTATVGIDPSTFSGQYLVSRVTPFVSGPTSFTVVTGVGFQVQVANAQPQGSFVFDVDAAGNVTSRNTGAATGTGGVLTFNTGTVTVDPGLYPGQFLVARVTGFDPVPQVQTMELVHGLGYTVVVGGNSSGNQFVLNVADDGNVSSTLPAATGSGNVLTFNTTSVSVTPDDPTKLWGFVRVLLAGTTGASTVDLLPGLVYGLWETNTASNAPVSIGDPCSVSPSVLTQGSTTFQIACGGLNAPPTADAGGPYSGAEGSTIAFDASASSDPDEDILTYSWDFGDGSSGTGATPTHAYVQDGSYTATLTVTDPSGEASTATAAVSVANLAPSIATLAGPVGPVGVGTTVSIDGTFTDPGSLDTHTVSIDWGDGASNGASVGTGDFSGSHAYVSPGVYAVSVTIVDDGGASDTETFRFAVVFDPSGGFATGGGWITSPSGAYPADPSSSGKLSFGFNSKYKKNATSPTGQLQASLQGGFSFHSDMHEWLVVAGARAQLQGTGTLDGAGGYGFQLTAVDGQAGAGGPDSMRLKIWALATGAVVFDNRPGADDATDPGTPLGGGNVRIHD